MEEDTIELIDYLRVIWKKKILVIVGILVCIVAEVTVSLRLPKIYHVEALIRIGKIVNIGSVPSSHNLVLLDTIEHLVKSIPVESALEEALGYDLNVEAVKGTSLIEIVLEGSDERKTKELLGEVVEKLIADHLSRTESFIQTYKALIGGLEANIGEIQNDFNQEALALKEISTDMNKEMSIDMNVDKLDPFAFMAIQAKKTEIQNKTIAIQSTKLRMKQGRINIRLIRNDIFLHQLTINSLKENKTRLVGEVVGICVKPKNRRNIMIAGVVGLMMSLFLAFFIEYLGNARKREGEK